MALLMSQQQEEIWLPRAFEARLGLISLLADSPVNAVEALHDGSPQAVDGVALRVEAVAQALGVAVQLADDRLGIKGPLEDRLRGIAAAKAHAVAGGGIGNDRHIITSVAAAVSASEAVPVVAPAEDNRQDNDGPQAFVAKEAAAVVSVAVVVGLPGKKAGQKLCRPIKLLFKYCKPGPYAPRTMPNGSGFGQGRKLKRSEDLTSYLIFCLRNLKMDAKSRKDFFRSRSGLLQQISPDLLQFSRRFPKIIRRAWATLGSLGFWLFKYFCTRPIVLPPLTAVWIMLWIISFMLYFPSRRASPTSLWLVLWLTSIPDEAPPLLPGAVPAPPAAHIPPQGREPPLSAEAASERGCNRRHDKSGIPESHCLPVPWHRYSRGTSRA